MAFFNLTAGQEVLDITDATVHQLGTNVWRNRGYRGMYVVCEVSDVDAEVVLTPRIHTSIPGSSTTLILSQFTTAQTAVGVNSWVIAPTAVAGSSGDQLQAFQTEVPHGDYTFEMRHGNAATCSYKMSVMGIK